MLVAEIGAARRQLRRLIIAEADGVLSGDGFSLIPPGALKPCGGGSSNTKTSRTCLPIRVHSARGVTTKSPPSAAVIRTGARATKWSCFSFAEKVSPNAAASSMLANTPTATLSHGLPSISAL
jgi:hypothetical protein